MTRPAPADAPLLTPRKIVIQLVGFVTGVALLGWIISTAVQSGGWSRLAEADPWLIAGLAGCSLLSLVINGVIFWVVIRPVRPQGFLAMQWLNMVVAVLNYAPIRLGLIARVAYHLRVDRMPLLLVGGWLTAMAYTMALALGACIAATIVWPHFDLIWGAIVLGQVLLGGLLTRAIMGQSIVLKFGRGMERMLGQSSSLWGALALRLVDTGAFAGRMACAVAILGLDLSTPDILLLGFAALALSLNPLGRTGFREVAVTFVASRMVTGGSETQIDSDMATLALVESAGEAIINIPLGAVALLWYRKKWSAARAVQPGPTPGPKEPEASS